MIFLFVRPTIERLPLGGNIDKVVGGVHPGLEDEISRGRQMASRQKQASALALVMICRCTYDGDGVGGGGGCDQDTDYGDGDACIYWSASSEDPTRSAIVSCCVACHRRDTHKISTFSLVFNRLTRFNLFFKGWSCWVACHRRELVQSSW